jgi:tetratricopeptide (TPR) repeat protein
LKLTGEELKRLTKRYTENTEAYQAYLKGRWFWNKRTKEGMEKAIEYFHEAIGKDPEFALPYTGIADSYVSLGWFDLVPRDVAFTKAKEAAIKAIEIDNTVSEAHVSLANVEILCFWDWVNAEKEFKRALELNPSNAEVHHQYAHLLASTGRLEEGVLEMRRALEFEPISVVINSCMGQNLYYACRYNAAIEQLQKAIEIDPSYYDPYGWLGMAYLLKGMQEQAITMFQKAKAFPRYKTRMIGALGYAYAIQGMRSEALNKLKELEDLSKEGRIDLCYIAWIFTGLGEKKRAFEWLEKAYEEKSNLLIMLKVDPFYESLRSDPRFRTLLKKMRLE